MPQPTQAALLKRLRAAQVPEDRRDHAIALLDVTRSRDKIDACLHALLDDDVIERLDDAQRPVLRAKAADYYEHPTRDRGGLIREQITRLLTAIGHPDDVELYVQGCGTYYRQPATDSAQNLRAAALAGLSSQDRDLACAYAVKLLGEPDTSTLNGQPSITAINVLAHHGQRLPVYQFVLRQGRDFIQRGNGEVVSRAIDVLGRDFPPALFAALAEDYVELDVPVALSGVVNAITTQRLAQHYPLLERIITRTQHAELRHYTLVMLAAARDDDLTALLYRLARTCSPTEAGDYAEAVELTSGDARDELLERLHARSR